MAALVLIELRFCSHLALVLFMLVPEENLITAEKVAL
jgi:hypothetical protein